MLDALKDFYQAVSLIDLIFLIITIFSVIKCYSKGFVLSLLSASKWLLAYVVTLILFPKAKPYFKNIIDSEINISGNTKLRFSIYLTITFKLYILIKSLTETSTVLINGSG